MLGKLKQCPKKRRSKKKGYYYNLVVIKGTVIYCSFDYLTKEVRPLDAIKPIGSGQRLPFFRRLQALCVRARNSPVLG